jgi:hypothetical protein
VLVKLYKVENGILNYWEIWDTDTSLFIHSGELGDTGESKTLQIKPNKLKNIADQQIQNKIDEGYFHLDDDQLNDLIIQFEAYESAEDLNFREAIQNIINQTLGWTGNGHSINADIGNGKINIFSNVIDPYIACQAILKAIQEQGIHRDFLIVLKKQSGFEVLYPENFIGNFTY